MKRTHWNDVDVSLVSEDAVNGTFDGTEAGLNLCIATWAHLYGWNVEREVVIPGWGRLDLLLTLEAHTFPIELKLSLEKPAQVRRAFQQADGYYRWLTDNGVIVGSVVLAGQVIDWAVVDEVSRLYDDVTPTGTGSMMSWLVDPGWVDESFTISQRERAHHRLLDAEAELVRRRAALGRLPMPPLPEVEPTEGQIASLLDLMAGLA